MNPEGPSERCKEIFALLSEYLDMALPPAACQDVQTHLEGCPSCIEFAESLRKSIELCRRYSPTELPKPLGEDALHELRKAYQKMLSARKAGG